VSTFLSSVAVLLSTLALLCSGYAAYQVFTLQQTIDVANTRNDNATATNQTTSTQGTGTVASSNTSPPSREATPSPSPTATAESKTTASAIIQPDQFVQPAFGKKAQVALLSVKRIKDPETGNRDVVNVQMRIRRLATDDVSPTEQIGVSNTTARNPDTSETYKGVDLKRSTGSISLSSLRPKASADAYVWLRIPEGVNSLDIFVPDTGAFSNVPISS
jgi:cytoskeletal protein RodZ